MAGERGAGSTNRVSVSAEVQNRPIIRRRPASEEPVKHHHQESNEDNLIKFPVVALTDIEELTGSHRNDVKVGAADSELPAWRMKVREKVRESRERRGIDAVTPESRSSLTSPTGLRKELPRKDVGKHQEPLDEALADPNPIVESALRRIRRTTPPLGNRPLTSGGQALSMALDLAVEIPNTDVTDWTDKAETVSVRSVPAESSRKSVPETVEERELAPESGKEIRSSAPPASDATISRETSSPSRRIEAREPVAARQVVQTQQVTPRKIAQRTTAPGQKPAVEPMAAAERVAEPVPAPEVAVRTTKRFRPQPQPIETSIIGVPQTNDSKGGHASFWVRTLAGGCDFEIIAVSFLPIFGSYAVLNTILEQETLVLMLILLAALTFVYQAVTLTIAGRTYGMAMLNLRLVSLGNDPELITKRQRLMRAWAATIAFLLPPLNLLVRQVNSRRLSLPDLVSGTIPVEV